MLLAALGYNSYWSRRRCLRLYVRNFSWSADTAFDACKYRCELNLFACIVDPRLVYACALEFERYMLLSVGNWYGHTLVLLVLGHSGNLVDLVLCCVGSN